MLCDSGNPYLWTVQLIPCDDMRSPISVTTEPEFPVSAVSVWCVLGVDRGDEETDGEVV